MPQAIVDRVKRELPGSEGQGTLAVLDAREAFLFRGGHDLTILDQTGRGVMKSGVDSKCVHGYCPAAMVLKAGMRPATLGPVARKRKLGRDPSNSSAAAATVSG